MKPVYLYGYFDHEHEQQVRRFKDGELGCDIVTPFYTHLDKNGFPCGVIVNRGWMPDDLKDFRYDRQSTSLKVTGVIYRGDNQNKYSLPNSAMGQKFYSTIPSEHARLAAMPNSEAETFMIKAIDFDEDARTTHPDVESRKELQEFTIKPERHAAYQAMWDTIGYFGIVSNAIVWLYM